jgi:hypothetical protein
MRALGDRLDVHTRHAASRVTGGLPAMLSRLRKST